MRYDSQLRFMLPSVKNLCDDTIDAVGSSMFEKEKRKNYPECFISEQDMLKGI